MCDGEHEDGDGGSVMKWCWCTGDLLTLNIFVVMVVASDLRVDEKAPYPKSSQNRLRRSQNRHPNAKLYAKLSGSTVTNCYI